MRQRLASAILLAAAAIAATPAAAAGDYVDSYCAQLSAADHFSSSGVRLDNIAAIIRQDRANVHEFGIRDQADDGDTVFGSKANRARLERMLRNGTVTRQAARAIINGTPIVCVEIYEDFVNVTLQ